MIGDHLDLHEHTRARLIQYALERAQLDALSCVVSGPRVVGCRVTEAIVADRERRAAAMMGPSMRGTVRRFERTR